MLKSQLDGANSQLGKVQLELSESRSTAWKRKEEIDAMTKQVNTEKAQVRALKADIDYKIKATKQLEETIDGMQTRHWDKVGQLAMANSIIINVETKKTKWIFIRR